MLHSSDIHEKKRPGLTVRNVLEAISTLCSPSTKDELISFRKGSLISSFVWQKLDVGLINMFLRDVLFSREVISICPTRDLRNSSSLLMALW